MPYYNTTNITGVNLNAAWIQTARQEEIVLVLFEANPNRLFAPQDVHRHVLQDCPLTSVRRAITDLTTKGKLFKSDTQVKGLYGKPTFTWGLVLTNHRFRGK
jgi:hypothetical protein